MTYIGKPIDPKNGIGSLSGSDVAPATQQQAKEYEPVTTTGVFEPREPRYSLSNVILPESASRQVDILKNRLRHHKTLYEDWGLEAIDPQGKRSIVNFYGPPGTGKTMLVEALAQDFDLKIIDVSYAEIESKYVGETGKNIRLAFRRATETGSLLFFDEADSILGKRMTSVTQAADHAVNVARAVMLKELDAFDGIVMFATNLAKNFDGAFVRRILQHVEVPPPDAAGRKRLWEHMVPRKTPGRNNLDWGELSNASEDLCGGDIKNAVILALTRAVAREGEAKCVHMDDFLEAIESVYRAKRDIGSLETVRWEDATFSVSH